MGTVVTQFVCSVTGFPLENVIYEVPDTELTPDSGETTASRQTLFTGEATRRAAESLKEALGDRPLSELNNQEFYAEYCGVTDKLGSDKENPVSHIAYGYATHLVDLDENGRLLKVIAAHDVGKAINPVNVEGQIEGGVVMMTGIGQF